MCPPKGSHTGLNYDIIRAKNITLDNKDRQEMINYAVEHILYKEAELYKDFHETFIEKDRPKNWLDGVSYITLPTLQNYTFLTTALSGSVSTPSFRKPFDQEEFLPQVDWKYIFLLQPTFKTDHSRTGTFFVIEITFDSESNENLESIDIGFIWDMIEKSNDAVMF